MASIDLSSYVESGTATIGGVSSLLSATALETVALWGVAPQSSFDAAKTLNCTHAVVPLNWWDAENAISILSMADEMGISVIGNISALVDRFHISRDKSAWQSFRDAVHQHPALAGWLVGLDADSNGMAFKVPYTALVDDIHRYAFERPTIGLYSWGVLQSPSYWLGICRQEGISAYSTWGMQGALVESGMAAGCESKISEWAASSIWAGSNTTSWWVWLQGFYDKFWGIAGSNAYPSRTSYSSVIDYARNADSRFRNFGFWAWSGFQSDRKRVEFLAHSAKIRREVAFTAAKYRGLLAIDPVSSAVPAGGAVQLSTSLGTASWQIVSGPNGASINGSGLYTAGASLGTSVIRATVGAKTAQAAVSVYSQP